MAGSNPKRLAKDFDVKKPDLEVTDPENAEIVAAGKPIDREYPKHVVKFESGPGSPRLVQVVTSEAEERKARAQGYGSHQDLDAEERKAADAPKPKAEKAVKPAKPVAAKKPRNRQPKSSEPIQ